MALVKGSRAVFDEGVKTPIRGKFLMVMDVQMSVEMRD
jgi:hypothetical protein